MKSIICDWGTTNLRAYLLENGEVIDEFSSSYGLKNAKEIGFAKALGEVFVHFDAPINTAVKLSGMIGSKHGWKEAPYAFAPVNLKDMRQNYVSIDELENVQVLGGVCYELPNGKKDVMRGEEVQVFGVLAKFPHVEKICLPGTHSKWVDTKGASINSFSTWMTGDLFNSLSQHTIFKEQISSQGFHKNAFLKGVESAQKAGPLLNSIFHLRTEYLFGIISSEEFHSYLSGFLIGSEIKDAAGNSEEVIVCGSGGMVELYSLALNHFGIIAIEFPASEATVLGMQRITEERAYE